MFFSRSRGTFAATVCSTLTIAGDSLSRATDGLTQCVRRLRYAADEHAGSAPDADLTKIQHTRAMHTSHTIIDLHETARTLRRDAHGTFGARVASEVVMRPVGYVTRVSAKRAEAGCATERLSAIRELARSTQTHGVQVANGTGTQRTPGSRQEASSA